MNVHLDPWGKYMHADTPGAFTVYGVKKQGFYEHGTEYFESCQHDDPEAIGWTVSYDGQVFCPITFKDIESVKLAIQLMVGMFHAGVRFNQFRVKKVLGID